METSRWMNPDSSDSWFWLRVLGERGGRAAGIAKIGGQQTAEKSQRVSRSEDSVYGLAVCVGEKGCLANG